MLEDPQFRRRGRPQDRQIVVVALKSGLIDRIEPAVVRTHPIPARLDAEIGDRSAGAFVDLELPSWQVQARLGDVVPPVGVAWRLGVVDLDFDGHCHVPLGLDHEHMRSGLDSESRILVGVVFRGLGVHASIPEVELVVIGEQLKRLVLRPHERLRWPLGDE